MKKLDVIVGKIKIINDDSVILELKTPIRLGDEIKSQKVREFQSNHSKNWRWKPCKRLRIGELREDFLKNGKIKNKVVCWPSL